jgi:hypothetical protein
MGASWMSSSLQESHALAQKKTTLGQRLRDACHHSPTYVQGGNLQPDLGCCTKSASNGTPGGRNCSEFVAVPLLLSLAFRRLDADLLVVLFEGR